MPTFSDPIGLAQHVASALERPRPTGVLIETPPGCDEFDFIGLVRAELAVRHIERYFIAVANAGAYVDDHAFVTSTFSQWCSAWPRLQEYALATEAISPDLPPALRLQGFLGAPLPHGHVFLLLIYRFDRAFARLTSELLAILREAELGGRLVSINTSHAGYSDLYQARARTESTFTSDYGTSHPRVTMGALSREAALAEWTSVAGSPPGGGSTRVL